MARNLDTITLTAAAKAWAGQFLLPTRYSKKHEDVAISGPEFVYQCFYNMHFKDEFDFMMPKFRAQLGADALAEFDAEAAKRFSPRSDKVFADLLAEKLAVDVDGNNIPGKIGTTIVGSRLVGERITRHGKKNATWNVYAGEGEARAAGFVRPVGEDGEGADPLPPAGMVFMNETMHLGAPEVLLALNTNVSIAFAQVGLDAALDLLDEGSADGVIQGRTGAQPVDPDAAVSGTNLFSLDLGTPAFGGAADDSPGALATAAAIADDTSADATGTLGYCRASSANSSLVPLNDHIDGEAGTSGADFNFNTVAIVSGATVSMTSWTVTQPQGPTAT